MHYVFEGNEIGGPLHALCIRRCEIKGSAYALCIRRRSEIGGPLYVIEGIVK